MNMQDLLSHDELAIDDYPTLCSIPPRAELFEEADRSDAVIVRGTD
ncbi:hypothetical protein [Lentzea flava]|uniref:Uncharacterized protein n=1 Tax=Lentzea flava TaxID=103732 RepID=A0ABQ2UNM1_9PSEU|nr:hypothetical protein [Lentzea flava]MCP2200371.1 hypothetical protein [Lentzea flava]GGU43043.1 hypothetical protein GCM10010178_39650 [Lentzea flava]